MTFGTVATVRIQENLDQDCIDSDQQGGTDARVATFYKQEISTIDPNFTGMGSILLTQILAVEDVSSPRG